MAQVAPGDDGGVDDAQANLAGRRAWQPQHRPPPRPCPRRDDGRRRPAVLARRSAGQLQEDIVERGPAQPEVAHPDAGAAQLGGGLLDQLQAVPRSRKREPVRPLVGLGLAAAHPGEHPLRLVALSGARELQLEDLTPDPILELAAGSLRDHLPVVDDGDPVGELVGLLEVLRREQERRPLAPELAHDRPDLVAAARIEPGRGLVEEQDPRAREQARREIQAAPHTARVGARGAIRSVRQVETLEQLGGAAPGLVPRELEQAPEHLQVLAPGQDLVDGRELPGQPEQLANRGGLAHDVVPEDLCSTLLRREQRGEDPDQRGLSGAVRAEQPEHCPLGHLEVDAGERDRRAEALGHSLDANGGRGGTDRGQCSGGPAACHELVILAGGDAGARRDRVEQRPEGGGALVADAAERLVERTLVDRPHHLQGPVASFGQDHEMTPPIARALLAIDETRRVDPVEEAGEAAAREGDLERQIAGAEPVAVRLLECAQHVVPGQRRQVVGRQRRLDALHERGARAQERAHGFQPVLLECRVHVCNCRGNG